MTIILRLGALTVYAIGCILLFSGENDAAAAQFGMAIFLQLISMECDK